MMAEEKKHGAPDESPDHSDKNSTSMYEEAGKTETGDQPPNWRDDDIARVTDHKAERALCFKFDIRLLPVLAVMCMFMESPQLSQDSRPDN
jgi:hypothetical protein